MANEVRLAAKITYLGIGPLGDNQTELSDERVFAPFSLANGLGVGNMHLFRVRMLLENQGPWFGIPCPILGRV